jgi:FAD-linked sulfhydryl oxidase
MLDSNTWGPHYWFFLHTIAISYPKHPNAITKKKMYDLIQNLSQFIPVEKMAKDFDELLNMYPITAYLDTRDSLIKWMHFIHNKINEKLEKPKITLNEFYFKYYEEYKPKDVKFKEYYRWKEKIIYTLIVVSITCVIIYNLHYFY